MECLNCKFWEKTTDKWDLKHYGRHIGKCSSKKFSYDSACQKDGLMYVDSEHYSAFLFTGENFGCIHFMSKK